ncbi:MAG: Fe-S cluster assembly ATPase SufC [Clostridia bacterium]|nr:Fe-S cluster assembly ATPase SufC [Clostridia bacterium]
MEDLLVIKNLSCIAGDNRILDGLDLTIKKGEVHVIMGPNGTGKSTLANVIFNNPAYTKTSGEIWFDGKDITDEKTDEIARRGIFMSFQTPEEVEGISVFDFIKMAKTKKAGENISYFDYADEMEANMKELEIAPGMEKRDLNVGYSGGEKKKNEILQMLELSPKLAILDETDSGLDVDAVKIVSKGIKLFKNDENAILIITHSCKLLEGLHVDYVHVMMDGKIVKTGDASLAREIDRDGYQGYKA